MTESEFKQGIAMLQAGAQKNFGPDGRRAYWLVLCDLPNESFEAAILRFLAEDTTGFPSPGKIRQLALEHDRGLSPLAGEAWERRCHAVRRLGYYQPDAAREYCGPVVWSVISQTGGWEFHCDCPADQRSTLAAQFRKAFDAMTERETKLQALPDAVRPQRIPFHEAANALAKTFRIPQHQSGEQDHGHEGERKTGDDRQEKPAVDPAAECDARHDQRHHRAEPHRAGRRTGI